MRKFKKGDLVRCTGESVFGDAGAIGFEGHITMIWADGTFSIDKNWVMAPKNLELIKAAKPTRKELKKKIKELEDKVKEFKEEAPEFRVGDQAIMEEDGMLLKKGTITEVLKVVCSGNVQLKTICCESTSKLRKI